MKRDYKGPALRTSLCQSKGIKANKHLECVFNTMGGTCSDFGEQVPLESLNCGAEEWVVLAGAIFADARWHRGAGRGCVSCSRMPAGGWQTVGF